MLLDRRANIDAVTQSPTGETALHLAARSAIPRLSFITLLIEKGATVDAKKNEGKTALHLATEWGRESLCRTLLRHGADPPIEVSPPPAPYIADFVPGSNIVDLAKKNSYGASWFDAQATCSNLMYRSDQLVLPRLSLTKAAYHQRLSPMI